MSNAFAIAGVTAVLEYYFFNTFNGSSPFPATVNVSSLAPDQVHNNILNDPSKTDAFVNLFLYEVSHNAAWRNADLASLDSSGSTRLSNPPLALDLHYLLTVYGWEDWEAEALLGYALMMLHETPVLSRDDIANALSNLGTTFATNTLSGNIKASGLADQIEMIKITPERMTREEIAWLWTALKADYRPTYPFMVSVVLMQPQQPASAALPVMTTKFGATPLQPAQILAVQAPAQGTALPGETVRVFGESLTGASSVVLTNAQYEVAMKVPVASSQPKTLSFMLPPDPGSNYPAGIYGLAVRFEDSNGNVTQTTNTLPIAVSPTLSQTVQPTWSGSQIKVTLGVAPDVWAGQTVTLALSTIPPATTFISVSAPAQPFVGPAGSVDFLFDSDPALQAGPVIARLLVDGVASRVSPNPDQQGGFSGFQGPTVTVQP